MTIVIILVISSFILFLLIAGLEGFVRAHYEDYTYFQNRGHRNLHPWYLTIRGLILLYPSYIIWYDTDLWHVLFFVIACASAYSFIYNGVLYTWRNNLAPQIYVKRFFANKERGDDPNKAGMNLTFWQRVMGFIVGCAFIVGIIMDIAEMY